MNLIFKNPKSLQRMREGPDANLTLKEEILAKTKPHNGKPGRYKADDQLLAFLQHL
jgi:hypothetical protein